MYLLRLFSMRDARRTPVKAEWLGGGAVIWLICALAALMLFLGFEMFIVLGVPSLLIKEAYYGGMPDVVLIQKMVAGIDHSILLSIPFFIFAAELMSEGRLARAAQPRHPAMFRRLRGGAGYSSIAACMAFGSVCGSAPATVAALGRLMHPRLRADGFSDRFSLGLIVSAAETALLIPPSITLIIYGWLTETSISRLFAGGLVVGIVLGLAFAGNVLYEVWRRGLTPREEKIAATSQVVRGTAWALGMPLIILGGIYSGIVTATEAAAVSVLYAVFVEAAVFRALTLRQVHDDRPAQRRADVGDLRPARRRAACISFFITLAQVPRLDPAVHEGDRRRPVPVPAGRQHRAADRRHVHRSGHRDPDPDAGAVPGRGVDGHRPGAFRAGGLPDRVHRHDHARRSGSICSSRRRRSTSRWSRSPAASGRSSSPISWCC